MFVCSFSNTEMLPFYFNTTFLKFLLFFFTSLLFFDIWLLQPLGTYTHEVGCHGGRSIRNIEIKKKMLTASECLLHGPKHTLPFVCVLGTHYE